MRKKCGIIFVGLLITGIASAAIVAAEPSFEKCLHWKTACAEKLTCINETSKEVDSCFRCLKPSRLGLHLYTSEIDRMTCNLRTASYLTTMGYRCYHPQETAPCFKTKKKSICKQVCVEYQKPN